MPKTVCISISNQKGGIGKTTTSMLITSMLHAATKNKILVYDVDPQGSFEKKRQTELEAIKRKSDSKLVAMYDELTTEGKGLFEVRGIDLFPQGDSAPESKLMQENVFEDIRDTIASGVYDMIFFDFPGYVSQMEYLQVLKMMNYIIIPFYLDDNSSTSTLDYINTIQAIKQKKLSRSLKNFAVFFWKYSKAKNVANNAAAEQMLRARGWKVFDSKIYDSTEFENNRSTVIPFDLKGEKSLTPFIKELSRFVRENEQITA
jgi:cellulose biosynthesis protein BcsQ